MGGVDKSGPLVAQMAAIPAVVTMASLKRWEDEKPAQRSRFFVENRSANMRRECN